mgnify:CR=1 FL=1
MRQGSTVHFLGCLAGLGENLLQKLIFANISCSIAVEWFDRVIDHLASDLEVIQMHPTKFDNDLVNPSDLVIYFLDGSATEESAVLNDLQCNVLVISRDANYNIQSTGGIKQICVYDLIPHSLMANVTNKTLDKMLLCLQNSTLYQSQDGSKKHWWVSQQAVALAIALLINDFTKLPLNSQLSGRRGWTDSETFHQLQVLYRRTMAGATGEFRTAHLVPASPVSPNLEKVTGIADTERPDLTPLNDLLKSLSGTGWRPLVPLRASLMQYLATKSTDYNV